MVHNDGLGYADQGSKQKPRLHQQGDTCQSWWGCQILRTQVDIDEATADLPLHIDTMTVSSVQDEGLPLRVPES